MITVSAKDLWWHEPVDCTCPDDALEFCTHDVEGGWVSPMYMGTIDGAGYITDQYSLLPIARVGELPVGYGHVLNLRPVPGQALEGFAEWLTATVIPDASTRLFANWLIDPLEEAGFRIRPLEGVKDTHGICDPDLALVGLVIPVRRALEADATTTSRVAS